MKKLIIGLIVLSAFSCKQSDTNKSNMQQAKIIEMVLWKSVEGISPEEAKKSITKLNDYVSEQPGFIARKTALAENGKFLESDRRKEICRDLICTTKLTESFYDFFTKCVKPRKDLTEGKIINIQNVSFEM